MQRLLILFSNHPWVVIISLLILSIVAAGELKNLEIQVSAEEMLVQDDPERQYFEDISKVFGKEQAILLYLQDEHVLAPAKLESLEKVIEQIESLPFVDRTESLFSIPYLRTVDGYLKKDPYLHEKPVEHEQGQALLRAAMKNPFVHDVIVSQDGKAMSVVIMLNPELAKTDDRAIVSSLDKLTKPLELHFEKVFTLGYQHVRNEVADKIKSEQGELLPLAVVALLIALFLLLRQLLDIFIPVMTATISILWTLGLMALVEVPLNVVTSIIPVLLIIVGSTEDIHLLSEFRHAQSNGMRKTEAVHHMAKKMGGIILLTFITTYLGFLSVGLSQIQVLWQFGLVAATGLLLNFVVTVALIPAALTLAGKWQLDGKSRFFQHQDLQTTNAKRYYHWLHQNRKIIIPLVILLSAAALTAATGIRINHNVIDSLNEDSVVKNQFEDINEHFAGLESMSVVLDSGIEGTFLKTRYLEEIAAIQDFIKQQGMSRSTTSFLDYLSLLNSAFEEIEEPEKPDSDEIVNELMIFLNHEHVKAYVSDDYSKARILVRHNISTTTELQAFVNGIQHFIDNNLDSGLQARLTGDSVLTLSATRAMIKGQFQSIAILLLIIILVISTLFLDLKVGILAALPNIFPVIVLFGLMGIAEIPLNIGTAMAAAIAIGIAVDDTMHFMLRYNQELKSRKSQLAAMYTTLHNEALPVFATSLALIAGFLVFSFSDFKPVAQFGQLSALVMLAALVADFIITPLAISALRLVTLWDMLSMELRKEVIEKSILFKGMRKWQIRRFILASVVRSYKPGEKIFEHSDVSNEMYLVMIGRVEVTHRRDDSEAKLREYILPGDVFGDVSLFANTPRRSDAVATEFTSLLVLGNESIHGSTIYHPLISSKLFFNVATHISNRFINLLAKQSTTHEFENKKTKTVGKEV